MIPSPKNMSSLQVTNWSKWFLQAHRVFKNFSDIEISRNPKVQGQVSTTGVVGCSSQAVPIFVGFAKRREIWRCPDGRQYPYPPDWTILEAFQRFLSLIGSSGKQYVFEFNVWFYKRSFGYTQCPSNATRYKTSPSSINNGSFRFQQILFRFILLEIIYFSSSAFFSKMKRFAALHHRIADGNTVH